ncbi:GntR family transcriptional regulator [Sphingopyxis sp.]|uniref:GntR family transcriptional regulator n=1 Tax=Sphingopyxis sp. TaxID=1908224 RepID=UPI0035AE6132
MERVYSELKAQITAGTYPPGTRLEASQLAKSLDASTTPVRDALNRLAGERLVESWHQEGFRQPLLVEADLHALYIWTAMLIGVALKGRTPLSDQPAGLFDLPSFKEYPEAVESLFRTIAKGSLNRELQHALLSAIDRSQAFRAAEARVDSSLRVKLAAMEEDYRFGRWTALRSKITSFHRRRIMQAGRVATQLRSRTEPLR